MEESPSELNSYWHERLSCKAFSCFLYLALPWYPATPGRGYGWECSTSFPGSLILVPRGRDPFGQWRRSRPLARPNDIPVLNGFVNTMDWDQNQSDLSDLTLSMCRVNRGLPVLDPARGRDSWCVTKSSAASGDENEWINILHWDADYNSILSRMLIDDIVMSG